MFRQVFRNLSPDTVNPFLEMFTIAGFFFGFFLNWKFMRFMAILQKRDFATFGYKRKSKVDFFLGIPLYLATF